MDGRKRQITESKPRLVNGYTDNWKHETLRKFILGSEGIIYIASGYMESFLSHFWKQWAFCNKREARSERTAKPRTCRRLCYSHEGKSILGNPSNSEFIMIKLKNRRQVDRLRAV
jgi:hypothetical protein